MRRREFTGAILGGAALFGSTAFGCGDHLLVIGRGVRFQHAYAKHRGNLVIYSAENQSSGNSKSSKLQATLKQAGHKLRAVQGTVQLGQALKLEKVDVVLTDYADLSAIKGELRSATSMPVVLPILFKPSKSEFAAAQKQYKFALKAPVDQVQILTAIDEAMKSRLKIGSKT